MCNIHVFYVLCKHSNDLQLAFIHMHTYMCVCIIVPCKSCRQVAGHLKELSTQVSSVLDDLETTRTNVATLTDHQSQLAREQFRELAKKCREEISRAVSDKKAVAKALDGAKRSLAKLQIELEVVRATNAKLQSHKSVVADDVSQLKSEVSRLQDQKKMLERRLSQNETLAAEREKTIRELETEKKKLKSQIQSSEKNWKNQLARHERDWEDRMAEMDAIQGTLAEEKEDLLREKALAEEKLATIESENRDLEEGKRELESKVGELECKITEMEIQLEDNTREMSRVRSGIAKVVVRHACSSASTRAAAECDRDRFTARETELKNEVADLTRERDALTESLERREQEQREMEARTKSAHENEEKIKELTAQLDSLKTENETIRGEIKSLGELRQSAVDNLQELTEAKESLQLDSQKVRMTLRTEISLLKTKLKSVEDEKLALEARVSDLVAAAGAGAAAGGRGRMAGAGGGGSAFQGIAGAAGEEGYVDGLRRQAQAGTLQSESQGLRRENTAEKKVGKFG